VVRDAVFEDVMAHGLPSCSGNALGLDRVAALLLGFESIAPLFCLPFLSQFPKGAVAKD
jgi:elongation factor P--beta-lysine ligase